MTEREDFDLADFLPYALSQAAEETSRAFQKVYRDRYGLSRAEWRTLFHLGHDGPMTAGEVCRRASLHKTKVSRAVKALEGRGFLRRAPMEEDRRRESLTLTLEGEAVHADLRRAARAHDRALVEGFSAEEEAVLRRCLRRLAGI